MFLGHWKFPRTLAWTVKPWISSWILSGDLSAFISLHCAFQTNNMSAFILLSSPCCCCHGFTTVHHKILSNSSHVASAVMTFQDGALLLAARLHSQHLTRLITPLRELEVCLCHTLPSQQSGVHRYLIWKEEIPGPFFLASFIFYYSCCMKLSQ